MNEQKEREEGFIIFSMKSDKAQYDSLKRKQDLLLAIISHILCDMRDMNISFMYKDVSKREDEPYLFEEKELFEKGNKNEI